MSKKLKIRKIIFGIRFKFSIIIILAVAFTSILIGFALINQHEEKIRDAQKRQGATILQGISDQAAAYLHAVHMLAPVKGRTPAFDARTHMIKQQHESLEKIGQYFSSVVGSETSKKNKQERVLDIAYLVDINMAQINLHWKKSGQPPFMYFNRITGAPFYQKSGRIDPLLEPTVVAHYLNTIDTDTYIGFASISDVQDQFKYLFKEQPKYIIIGMPVFNEKTSLYDEYINFKRETPSKKSMSRYLQTKRELPQNFIRRTIYLGLDFDYTVDMKTEKNKRILLYYLLNKYPASRLLPTQLKELNKEFFSMIDAGLVKDYISISKIFESWTVIQKKYGVPFQPKGDADTVRQECFYRLTQFGVPVSSTKSLDELARICYNKDLAGILGLYLNRVQYFPEMIKSENDIINLMVSILLRAIFLALLFPTFIIRSIKTLAEGAIEIGKGNFNKQIEIKGTDEIGRLADVFNVMTLNLKKAEEMKIEKIRMEKELITAQQIQTALLPEKLPEIRGLDFGAYYAAQTESGGDYYDFIDLGGGNLGITIADVSGHGVGSGLVMAMTRTLLHTYCTKSLNSKKIFEIINDYLKNNTASNYFVTMFYGILNLDSLKLTYSSAGHCQPLIVRGGTIRQLPAGGIALGVVSAEMFSKMTDTKEFQLKKGDYFIQYTDGVDEAMNAAGNEYGLERFLKAITANQGKMPKDMIKAIVKDIESFTGNIPQHDDITMIGLKVL